MSESAYLTYYQRNRDVILNRDEDYYENDKERLREHARDKYRNLSEDEKHEKREYGKNRYLTMSGPLLYIQEKKFSFYNFIGIMLKYFGCFYVYFLW